MTRLIGDAVLRHALENDARVERRAFDGGEQLVLRRMRQIPAQRDAAQFRIHQHRAVAVVPGQPQQPGLAGAIFVEPRPKAAATRGARAARDRVENIAGRRQARLRCPSLPG